MNYFGQEMIEQVISVLILLWVIAELTSYIVLDKFLFQAFRDWRFNNKAEGWFAYNVNRANLRARQNVAILIERIRRGEIHTGRDMASMDILKYFALCDDPKIELFSSTGYEIAVLTGYVRFWFVGTLEGAEYRLSGVEERNMEMLLLDWWLHDKNMKSLRRAVMKWEDEERRIAPKIKANKF